jgi:histidine triad (HIT) family protein
LSGCAFCKIVSGEAPATVVAEWGNAIGIVPLNPVAPGHVLVIPKAHVTDVAHDPNVTAATMRCAALWVREHCADANVITSRGPSATQTVFHLHVHVVPRTPDDGLALPWTKVPVTAAPGPQQPDEVLTRDACAAALGSVWRADAPAQPVRDTEEGRR